MMKMIDQSILLASYGFFSSTPTLAFIAIFFAKWFPWLLILAASIYAFVAHTRSSDKQDLYGIARSLFLTFLTAVVAWLAADTIKFLFLARRPFTAFDFTPLVLGENPLESFPSTHASIFAALGMTIFLRDKKTGKWFLGGALVIGLARIAVGVHYPIDILAGFLLGGVVAFICHLVLLRFAK